MSAVTRVACIIFLCSSFIGCDSSERKAEEFYLRGLKYKERGELRQAYQQFRTAVTYDPRHVQAHIELGMFFCRDRNYAQAIKHLLCALEYGDSSYTPYAYMGYAYEQLGNFKFSEHYYKQAIARAPGLIDIRIHLADVLEAQEKRREASDVLQEVISLKPDIENESVIRTRISLLRQPQSPELHQTMADVYIRHGDIKRGLDEYRKFERLDPHDPETVAKFGIFCAERKQFNIAAAYLEKAVELGITDRSDVRNSLGTAYEKLGKFHEAIEEYRVVLQLQPELSEVRWKLADLLERTEQYVEAADVLEEIFYKDQDADTNVIWSKILRLRGEDSKKAVVQLERFREYYLVDVVVNRAVQATLLVDTRAKYTIISEELAEHLNILLSTKTSEVHLNFFGRAIKAPLINLFSIKVGELEVQNIPTLIWDFSEMPQIDGVLGMSFLKHFQVEIQHEEQLLQLTIEG
jgi:Tfp pilus assembly protein PilF